MTTATTTNMAIYVCDVTVIIWPSKHMVSRPSYLWEPDWNRYHQCPACGQTATRSCKCMRSDQVCPNGHEWHYCSRHRRIVLCKSDHASGGCYCGAMPTIPMWTKE